jgi:hypothetical protein
MARDKLESRIAKSGAFWGHRLILEKFEKRAKAMDGSCPEYKHTRIEHSGLLIYREVFPNHRWWQPTHNTREAKTATAPIESGMVSVHRAADAGSVHVVGASYRKAIVLMLFRRDETDRHSQLRRDATGLPKAWY